MSTPNIVMTRIDERLVHGQGQLWIRSLGVNTVIVANDQAANDPVAQSLMRTVADKTIAMRFYTVQKVIEIIGRANEAQTIFIIVKNPSDALALVKGGVPIRHINIGNIHNADGKEKVTRAIYLDQEDKQSLKELSEVHNITFDTQQKPAGGDADANIDIRSYL